MIKVKHKDIAKYFKITTNSVAYLAKKQGGLKTFPALVKLIIKLHNRP